MTESFDPSEKKPALTLSPADAAALDALLETRARHSFPERPATAPIPGGAPVDAARSERVGQWMSVLAAAPVPAAPTDLLQRTLAAVQTQRMKIESPSADRPAAAPFRARESAPRKWSYFGEVAAMLIAVGLLIAVLIPAIGQARMSYRRTLCATNLAAVGAGVSLYAADYHHQLPQLASVPGANWLRPGAGGHTNTANLLPLLNAKYLAPQRLICAGQDLPDNTPALATNGDIANCGYSYVNLFGPDRPSWDGSAATIVLADKSPLFTAAGARNADQNSYNHAQKGNYVLHADGHATWELSPNVGPANDNIWTLGSGANRLLQYAGTEVATTSRDVFLSP